MKDSSKSPHQPKTGKQTLSVHLGMDPDGNHGIPNPPVYHTSTIMRASLADYRNRVGRYDYGRMGTPTSEACEQAVAALYEADQAVATSSGLAAIALGISAVLKAGDHALFPDSMYGSGRRFVEQVLPLHGISFDFYDPCCSAQDLAALIGGKTRLVYLESPGSLTFEMQDLPALTAAAKAVGCLTACDNTWGTPIYFNGLNIGIDIIIEAGTKYISGHSDVSIGFVISNGETAAAVREYANNTGITVAPDELYLCIRGMRTLPLRLRQSEANGLACARWLEAQPEVSCMLHPALPSHPGHQHWQRDFSGSCGLFGFCFAETVPQQAIDAMADGLVLFGIGASWGGHESLITQGRTKRAVTPLPAGTLMRVYAGLEDTADLLADLEAGFARLRKISG